MSGIFFFKQKTAYEIRLSLVGSEMCIRDSFKCAPSWVTLAASDADRDRGWVVASLIGQITQSALDHFFGQAGQICAEVRIPALQSAIAPV